MIYSILKIFLLAFVQNISFSIVSRSRNRDHKAYHIIASIFSNSIWFLTFRELILGDMNYILFIPYVIGTVIGSTFGMSISMWIESQLGAKSDSHINDQTNKSPKCKHDELTKIDGIWFKFKCKDCGKKLRSLPEGDYYTLL